MRTPVAGRLLSVMFVIATALCAPGGAADGAAPSSAPPPPPPQYPQNARNTEKSQADPTPADEALKMITVPEGFHVTLFAAEPYVAQPISMTFDDRGRLWVAECYSYESSSGPWNQPIRDRILIFEDTDNDGQFDSRKVFSDQVQYVTSIQPGFGGVWVCATPRLLFIPDRDHDDVPDAQPQVMLDGWNNGRIGHCVFNGLTWGLDGWLYGTQGIQGESLVGKPGDPDESRRKFNGGVWRFHPTRHVFEVVCEGTTNPWGLDFDDYGQAFFTNCVIGHLWQVIPGAHYKRMYGQDYTPNTYGLIDQCADHLHWTGTEWAKSRTGQEQYGGGHAHCGAMIYLGDNWPDRYRGSIFMNNIHGHRVNNDRLERQGSGYVGRHNKDFLLSKDPWFKGITLRYGPDGGVFLSDWSDIGECHDTDSVHRTSGRIYKVIYGQATKPAPIDLARMTDAELVALQLSRNDWHVRHARRILQERAAGGADMAAVHAALRKMLDENPDVTRKLRAIWALYVTAGLDDGALIALLDHPSEHVRGWAVRLLVDRHAPPAKAAAKFAAMAANDPSALVRLALASALQRMPVAQRWDIAAALVAHGDDAKDHNLPLMIWYGIEPMITADRGRAVALLGQTQIPLLRQYIARRVGEGK